IRPHTLRPLARADVPLERILGALRLPRDLSRPPLCQEMYNLPNLPKHDLLRSGRGDLSCEVYPPPQTGRTKADVWADVYRGPEGLGGYFEYNSDLFSAATARRLVQDFTGLIARVGADADLRLSEWKG